MHYTLHKLLGKVWELTWGIYLQTGLLVGVVFRGF